MHQTIFFILSFAILQLTFACYITNCPIGGKRNLLLENDLHQVRDSIDIFRNFLVRMFQCPTCGINGQCYGPSICCTNRGCRIGHPSDIRQCSNENHRTIPCSIKAAVCTAVPNGRCAANSICCNPGRCFISLENNLRRTSLVQNLAKSMKLVRCHPILFSSLINSDCLFDDINK